MAKEAVKTDTESPADRIAREKAEAEATKKAELPDDVADDELEAAMQETDDEVDEAALAAIEASDQGPFDVEADDAGKKALEARRERAQTAGEKLRKIAQSYPITTPDEHTIFGFGGERFSLGELRSLFGLPGPRG